MDRKVALITGGTHGIGMAIGKVLGQAGAKICVNDISEEKLEECKAEYKQAGIDVYALKFNVTDEAKKSNDVINLDTEKSSRDATTLSSALSAQYLKGGNIESINR